MKLNVRFISRASGYFVSLNRNGEDDIYEVNADEQMAEYLNILYEDYIKILLSHRAYLYQDGYYFNTEKDVEEVIKALDPYLIMTTLIGE